MNQHHFNLINGEDTFFLTFLGAWVSVRIGAWGVDKPFYLIVLIIAILCFSIMIAQVRYWINNGKSTEKSIKIYSGAAIVIFAISIQYVYFKNYLSSSDLYILIGIAVLWLLAALCEKHKYHNFVITKDSKEANESAKQAV
ncbi:hypothetical protein [Bacillus wiedmannii]|uniref:hypothetical protein n=1 Tax=Bacillus wiedmannii TaxID=1890302 RepID=UPI003F932C43